MRATSARYRAIWRACESFSAPCAAMRRTSSMLARGGTPSLKIRIVPRAQRPRSLVASKCPYGSPMVSLFRTARMSPPSSFTRRAWNFAPKSPCSSPAVASRMIVESNRAALITRASSRSAAVPDALSFAPGESLSASLGSVAAVEVRHRVYIR